MLGTAHRRHQQGDTMLPSCDRTNFESPNPASNEAGTGLISTLMYLGFSSLNPKRGKPKNAKPKAKGPKTSSFGVWIPWPMP